VHHTPAGLPRSARVRGAVTRRLTRSRGRARHRGGRLALGTLASTVLTGLVLSVPVVSGAGGSVPSAVFGSSASTAASPWSPPSSSRSARSEETGDSPVIMGRDGAPTSAAATTADTSSAAPSTDAPAEEPAAAASPSTAAPSEEPAAAASPSSTRAAEETPSSSAAAAAAPADVGPPAAPTTAAAATVPARAGAEERLLTLVNRARAKENCAALEADGGLAAAARTHSAGMLDDGKLGLGNLPGTAAIVARGQADPSAVLDRWLDDHSDADAILDCHLDSAGIGVVEGPGGPWWTLLLA
jgi:uncharacterized protein YkwD